MRELRAKLQAQRKMRADIMTDVIVNPTEAYNSCLDDAYRFQFGAYGDTVLRVFGRSIESALEDAAEWLSEHAPGVFSDDDCVAELVDEESGEVLDHTYTEYGYIPSWEWAVDDLDRSELEERALLELCEAGELSVYFDRFDVCLAWYHYLDKHHSGQWSDDYLRLCKLTDHFKLGWRQEHIRGINENAAGIYARLVKKLKESESCANTA